MPRAIQGEGALEPGSFLGILGQWGLGNDFVELPIDGLRACGSIALP